MIAGHNWSKNNLKIEVQGDNYEDSNWKLIWMKLHLQQIGFHIIVIILEANPA